MMANPTQISGATWCVADAELCCDSPVEVKHRKLSRSLHRALVDRNLQPDSQERRQIQVSGSPPLSPCRATKAAAPVCTSRLFKSVLQAVIGQDGPGRVQVLLNAPWDWADLTGVKMNGDDKELLWRYRYALVKEPKALTKCLICVDWSAQHEVWSLCSLSPDSQCWASDDRI